METSGKAQEPRLKGSTGGLRGDPGRRLDHSLPTAPQCPGCGGELGASYLLLQEGLSVGRVCTGGTQPLPANPTLPPPPPKYHHHHQTQKNWIHFE